MHTAEQRAEYVVSAKAKRHAKALAEGRMPGQIGTPLRVTDEQRAASLAKKRNRDSKNSIKIRSAKRAAKALAEGRTPGMTGPRKFSDEELKASTKEVHARFRDKHCERRQEYQAKKKREVRATVEGALKHRASISKLRAKRNSASGIHTAEDIRALYFEQKGCCALCETPFLNEKAFHVDHWKPLSKGGSNDKSNLKLLHPKCNLMKHTKLPSELKIGVPKCS